MSAMTNFFEREMLNAMRGITATAPPTVYVALFLSNPTESGTAGTEVGYSGYARQPVTFSAPSASGIIVQMSNAAEITFPTPGGSSGVVTHGAIMTAEVGGNMLIYVELNNPITLTSEISPRFAPGEIALTMSGSMMDPAYKERIFNYIRGTNIQGFSPFMALFNGNPVTDEGVELGGAGYARLPIIFDEPTEQLSGQMMATNSNNAQSEQATTNWGSWAFMVIMDAETGGNRVWYRQNSGGTYEMNNNATVYLRAGNLRISIN